MKQPLRIAGLTLALASAFMLGGCSTLSAIFSSTAEPTSPAQRPAATSTAGAFDWDWDVRGDQAVRPIQVFSDGNKTWLQFGQRQFMPAVVVNGTPIPFDIAPPYLIVQGRPDRIDLIVSGYRATAVRRTQEIPTAWAHSGGAKVTTGPLAAPSGFATSQGPGPTSVPAAQPAVSFAIGAVRSDAYPQATGGTPAAAVASRIQRIPSSEIPLQ